MSLPGSPQRTLPTANFPPKTQLHTHCTRRDGFFDFFCIPVILGVQHARLIKKVGRYGNQLAMPYVIAVNSSDVMLTDRFGNRSLGSSSPISCVRSSNSAIDSV